MHRLPVWLALALSFGLATVTMTFVMPLPASGDEAAMRAARDRCGGYALLHARLSDFRTLSRFASRMNDCVAVIGRR